MRFLKWLAAALTAICLSSATLAQTVTDYPLHTIGGKDTFITNTSPYGYFGRAEYLLVGGTSAYQYRSMMIWDMTKLPALGTGDKAELIFYGLNISGYAPTAMELGMSATAWTDADPWKAFSWYSTVNKIIPATPYDNWMAVGHHQLVQLLEERPDSQQRHLVLASYKLQQVHGTSIDGNFEFVDTTVCAGDEGGAGATRFAAHLATVH